ncbi:MAG: transketolase [Deltaproteobacteria bacterium]|nr:transketolase [Deltaproteobacteria bacterium]
MKTMRDTFIDGVCDRMHEDERIFFLCADFGSPKLDRIRVNFKDRFINVGIAEQNLVNVATGLALEGFAVYAYAIAPFLTMRAYEQIRVNVALHAQLRELNVNLVGVGAGMSYDVSGPTHHCIEDIIIMRTLPNISVICPSDWALAARFVEYSLKVKTPKYLRFEGKPLPAIYENAADVRIDSGFYELKKGGDICLVSTGYMTHKALKVAQMLAEEGIDAGVLDVFIIKPFNDEQIYEALKGYRCVVTLEEGFAGKGGLDSLVACMLEDRASDIRLKRMGFADEYLFDIGSREYLHKLGKLDAESIIKNIKTLLRGV